MSWSLGAILYLAMVVTGFSVFIITLGVTSLTCGSRQAATLADSDLSGGEADQTKFAA